MTLEKKKDIAFKLLGTSLLGLLVSCSSSDSGSGGSEMALDGSAFASAVDDASCEVTTLDGSSVAGSFATSSDGGYSITLSVGSITEDLQVICTGGSFIDEATGLTDQTAGLLSAYIPVGHTGEVHLTPATTIIHQLITEYDKSAAEAASIFEAAFGFTPDLTVAPTDATDPEAGAETASLLSGLRAAAFSQLAADLGLSPDEQFALLLALVDDLSDGSLDGQGSVTPVVIAGTAEELSADIQHLFSQAVMNFRNGNDATGLANSEMGSMPFAKLATTDSYIVEYSAMSGAVNGKSEFSITVSDLADNLQNGLDVSIQPMMYMDAHTHSAPYNADCDEDVAVDGKYDCTVYYLMPSVMMSGTSMGRWELAVTIDDTETATFYPTVTMAMGDTAQVRLKGQDDEIASMDMGGMAMAMMPMPSGESRTYYLFKEELSGMTGNHTFKLYIAAKESMMSFPAIGTSVVLNEEDMNYELDISTIDVQVSTDASSWVSASDAGDGIWESSIDSLTDGEAGMLYVKLSVNGEQKTTDGETPVVDTNDYATFSVTPGGEMEMEM